MRKSPYSAALLLALAACSNPSVKVDTVDDSPKLQITNARPSAILILDGVTVGPAAAYDGKKQTLAVNGGTHRVEIRDGDRILFSGPVYFGGDAARTINLPD